MKNTSPNSKKSRIAIVDDHPLMRDALMQLMCHQRDLECVGGANSTADAKILVDQTRPDLVILDLRLKSGDALELIKTFRAEKPEIKVLVLSQYDELVFAERVLRAGACGYVMKDNATEVILEAIRTVLSGEVYFSNRVAAAAMRSSLQTKSETARTGVERLSDRELQVFQLIGASCSLREVARQFGLSVKTVETHRDNIKAKLNLQSAQAVRAFAAKWVAENLLPPLRGMSTSVRE
jgi:DNA-binding NarL/FixJ family response regulator